MLGLHGYDTLATERQHRLLEEAARQRLTTSTRVFSFRESLAAALIALAVWLAPSARADYRTPAIGYQSRG